MKRHTNIRKYSIYRKKNLLHLISSVPRSVPLVDPVDYKTHCV